jgi:hypothetical protein
VLARPLDLGLGTTREYLSVFLVLFKLIFPYLLGK